MQYPLILILGVFIIIGKLVVSSFCQIALGILGIDLYRIVDVDIEILIIAHVQMG